MSFAIGFGLGLASFTSIVSAAAVALAGPYLNVVSGSFADNSLVIRDTVTPANNYNGPLITNGKFNKLIGSRAGLAKMVGSDGLIQWAPHNMALQSVGMDTSWTKLTMTVTPGITDPEGGNTAVKLTANASPSSWYQARPFVGSAKSKIWVKRITGTGNIRMYTPDAGSPIIAVTNTWTQFSQVGPNAGANIYLGLDISVSGDEVAVWHPQAQATPTDDSYYPTIANEFHGPRIHYDPVTLAKLGYLHEGARTNLSTYSEQFDHVDTYWIKTKEANGVTPVVTSNYALAPDGTMTADRIQLDCGPATAADKSYMDGPEVSFVDTSIYTQSIWLKTTDGSTKTVIMNIAGAGEVVKTVTGTWTRFQNVWTASITFVLRQRVGLSGGVTSTTADLLYWGAQVELGGAASSYIPTTTVAVTRAADVLSLAAALFNLTQAAGTLYANLPNMDVKPDGTTNFNVINVNNAGDVANAILTRIEGSGLGRQHFGGVAGAANQWLIAAGSSSGPLGNQKLAHAYAVNDIAAYLNGVSEGTDVSAALPTTTQLEIGGMNGGVNMFGTIQEFAFIGERVSNAAMQALTT